MRFLSEVGLAYQSPPPPYLRSAMEFCASALPKSRTDRRKSNVVIFFRFMVQMISEIDEMHALQGIESSRLGSQSRLSEREGKETLFSCVGCLFFGKVSLRTD